MLIYMAIPVLIMVGLCIFSYMAGRYVRIGKKQKEIKVPEIIKEPEPPKEPDKVPILEEEIRNLKEALEIKNKELEERNTAPESIVLEASLSQPEKEPAVDNIAVLSTSSLYEDMLKEPKERSERKKSKEKVERKPRRKKR
ncbi:MAG: hypothetical protein HZA72_03955 [Candidatus Omnitrophica bacterium]|nr:hypothetical protein [Candidatus Omnitrophota bacterium]